MLSFEQGGASKYMAIIVYGPLMHVDQISGFNLEQHDSVLYTLIVPELFYIIYCDTAGTAEKINLRDTVILHTTKPLIPLCLAWSLDSLCPE